MQYDNTQVRRQDRLLDEEAARSLLRDGEYGILSMRDENGKSYGLPINYVWDNDNALYIHCAPRAGNYGASQPTRMYRSASWGAHMSAHLNLRLLTKVSYYVEKPRWDYRKKNAVKHLK